MHRLHLALALVTLTACSDEGEPRAVGDAALGADAALDGAAPADGGVQVGDGGPAPDSAVADAAAPGDASIGTVRLPPPNAPLDYQLGGAYPPPSGVMIVSRDREAKPAAGLYNICYVNGFQAQPGEADFWLKDEPDLVLRDGRGQPVIDPDWNEMLLDVSTEAKRTRLSAIVGGWILKCRQDGFDAVEIDNLDTFSRSSGRIQRAHAVAFMRLLSDVAHGAGLAIAQKNAAELVGEKGAMGTDFVVAEECNQWKECDVYTEAYGTHVLVIEYQRKAFDAGCRDFPELSIVLRDVAVSPPEEAAYVFQGC